MCSLWLCYPSAGSLVSFFNLLLILTDLSLWVFRKDGAEGEIFNMTLMFSGASNYSRSLCDWNDEIPTANVSVDDMFLDASSCESTQDPLLAQGVWNGPFCQFC